MKKSLCWRLSQYRHGEYGHEHVVCLGNRIVGIGSFVYRFALRWRGCGTGFPLHIESIVEFISRFLCWNNIGLFNCFTRRLRCVEGARNCRFLPLFFFSGSDDGQSKDEYVEVCRCLYERGLEKG
jgi:hypothetical protein